MNPDHQLVLGIAPNWRGFGYVVFEGPTRLVDWKVKRTPPPKNRKSIDSLKELLKLYMPSHVVFDAPDDQAVPRSARVTSLLGEIADCAAEFGAMAVPVPRKVVLETFKPLEAATHHDIARALVTQFPELEPYLPPKRRLWMTESSAMSIFHAAALVVAFYIRGAGD